MGRKRLEHTKKSVPIRIYPQLLERLNSYSINRSALFTKFAEEYLERLDQGEQPEESLINKVTKRESMEDESDIELDWKFKYIGEKDGEHYFSIISDDGLGLGQGISIKFHHFLLKQDGSILSLNYMEIPKFQQIPNKELAHEVMEKVTQQLHEWVPNKLTLIN